jgi:hypothetical protein
LTLLPYGSPCPYSIALVHTDPHLR